MAISTYQVYLMKGNTKLIDIKDFPDLGGDPEMLETTTLSDSMQTFIMGIQSGDALSFTANYTAEDFATIQAITGTQSYGIYLGPDGANGKFEFDGEISVRLNGGGVNEVVGMTITIAPSTPITFSAS